MLEIRFSHHRQQENRAWTAIHKRVRKPHLCAVDEAIPDAFHEREHVVVFRVQRNPLGRRLCQFQLLWLCKNLLTACAYLKSMQSVHDCCCTRLAKLVVSVPRPA